MPLRWLFLFASLTGFTSHRLRIPTGTVGATLASQQLFVWGKGLWKLSLTGGNPLRLSALEFGPGGCTADINADGATDLVLHQLPDKLVWLEGPRFDTARTIDTEASPADCMETTILGHRGILTTHRGLQVRFYEPPKNLNESRWPGNEIYSFYTASFQAGLLRHDVDGDGLPDILSGNYWIRSPESFELPWRLFAINTYNDSPQAAHLKLAVIPSSAKGTTLVVSQGEIDGGKLAIFRSPPDPTQLWIETRLAPDESLRKPAALAVADLDSDGHSDIVIAEREGGRRARLWWWRQLPDGRFTPNLISTGLPIHSLFVTDVNRDGRQDILVIGPNSAAWFENRTLK